MPAKTHPNDPRQPSSPRRKLFVDEMSIWLTYLAFTQADGGIAFTFKGMNHTKQEIWKNVDPDQRQVRHQ